MERGGQLPGERGEVRRALSPMINSDLFHAITFSNAMLARPKCASPAARPRFVTYRSALGSGSGQGSQVDLQSEKRFFLFAR